MKRILYIAIFILTSSSCLAQKNANSIVGTWLNNEKKAHIEIYEENGKYYGKVSKILIDKMDTSNVDERLKDLSDAEKKQKIQENANKMLNTIILSDLEFSNNEWKNGSLLVPKDNKTLKASVTLEKDNSVLAVKVKKGWFSKTIYWTKVNL